MAKKSSLQNVYEKSVDLHQAAQKSEVATKHPGIVKIVGSVTELLGALVFDEAHPA